MLLPPGPIPVMLEEIDMDFAKFVAEKEARQRFLGNIGPADRLKSALEHLRPCLSGEPGIEEGLLV